MPVSLPQILLFSPPCDSVNSVKDTRNILIDFYFCVYLVLYLYSRASSEVEMLDMNVKTETSALMPKGSEC